MKEIILSGKKGLGKFALVDDDIYEKIKHFKWHIGGKYVKRREGKTWIFLHKLVLSNSGFLTDHKDLNVLNCQRNNLRLATKAQNRMNSKKTKGSSIYKGVCWNKKHQLWEAYIKFKQKHIFIGYFTKELWGAMAYDIFAKEYFGEFARLNFY